MLVLLFPVDDEPFLALTLRGPEMDDHPGQVSFPGGRREHGEEYEDTALRESREEVGLLPETVRVVGRLSSLYIPPTDYCVVPVVGVTGERPDWRPDGTEVVEVIETPLGAFLGSDQPTREIWTIDGRDVEVPHFRVEGHQVWGATSMVLAELVAILRETL